MDADAQIDLGADPHFKDAATRYGFVSGKSTHADRLATIRALHANYADLPNVLAELNIPRVDGIVLDLGLSSDQLADRDRGRLQRGRQAGHPVGEHRDG